MSHKISTFLTKRIMMIKTFFFRMRRGQSNRLYKEKFWQDADSALTYAKNVSVTSVGMQTELAIATSIARGHVLDLGAGTGRFSRPLAQLGHDVTAADISDSMLKQGLQASTIPYKCVVTSALDPDLPEAHFDTVISFWLMLHFSEWKSILTQMVRLAKPGALIAFEFPNRDQYDEVVRQDSRYADNLTKQVGYETWLTETDVRQALEQLGCTLVWSRPYDAFNENGIARLNLGDRYEDWKKEVGELTNAGGKCHDSWRHFEATQLPLMHPAIGRKRIYVAQKLPHSDLVFQEPIEPIVSESAEFARTQELFELAFGSYLTTVSRR